MPEKHKKYLVLGNYGSHEGWRINDESDSLEVAVKLFENARQFHYIEVLIVEVIPICAVKDES